MAAYTPPSEAALRQFEKTFAKRAAVGLVRASEAERPEIMPSGSLALDEALVVGGIPRGRIVEMWGPEHAGKTTLALIMIAAAQQFYPGSYSAWIDMEQSLDGAYAASLGVDLSRLYLVENPRTAEEVADAHYEFVSSGLCIYSVIDSVGAMIAKDAFDRAAEKSAIVGRVAKIVTEMVKKAAPIGKANGTTTLINNQIRAVVGAGQYAPKEDTSGGWMLKHATTIKLKVRRGEQPHTITVNKKLIPVSVNTSVLVQKNKLAPYGRVANIWLANQTTARWGAIGLDRADEAATIGANFKSIERSGAWYTTPDGVKHNGRDPVVAHLRENPDVIEQIRKHMIEKMADQAYAAEDENAPEVEDSGDGEA